MKNVIFISSLSHSGSTLMDLTLGCHSKLIGVGEVARVILHEDFKTNNFEFLDNVQCACGNITKRCIFWSKVIPELKENNHLSFQEKYILILDIFHEIFGDDKIMVDSSKYWRHLNRIKNIDQISIQVIYIIKDVRAFSVSQIDSLKRSKIFRWLTDNKYAQFLKWYISNKKLQLFFNNHSIDYFQIGYEELCLNTTAALKAICKFLIIDYEPSMKLLNSTKSHNILGNRMRNQAKKKVIRYDYRWFTRKEWKLPSFLFPFVISFNKTHVYQNNFDSHWHQ